MCILLVLLLLLLLLLLLRADNSRRAFYKEFRKVVEASDVVIQVSTAQHSTTQHSTARLSTLGTAQHKMRPEQPAAV